VGTTLALLERQLKVMSAVQARLHYSFKQELRLLAAIIRDFTEPDYDYDPVDAPRRAKKEDYDHIDIIPVSDPNAATMSQRVVQYQAVIQMAQMAPDIYDLPQLHRGMLEVLGIKNADKLVPMPDDMKPKDPVSENMSIIKCEPAKAFMFQDHQSHIQVHMAMIQDPSIAQMLGQNPKAQQISAALMAHIAEHVGFEYRRKVEEQLGAALPQYDENLPPQAEFALASLLAKASQQVVQQSQTQAAQQQAQQQAQDPVLQLQQAELQLRQQELQIKSQDLQAKNQLAQQDMQLKMQLAQQDMQLKTQKTQTDAQIASERVALDREALDARTQIDGARLGVDIRKDQTRMEAEQKREGVRLGIDVAKHKAAADLDARKTALQREMDARTTALSVSQQKKESPTK
jgi:hypothetical protein